MEKKYYRIRVTAGKHNNGTMCGFDVNDVFSTKENAMEFALIYGYGSGVKDFEIDEVSKADLGGYEPHLLTLPNEDDVVDEVCPHCNHEVELASQFRLQRCPDCGRLIAPCNLCDHDLCDCLNCPLAILSSKLKY